MNRRSIFLSGMVALFGMASFVPATIKAQDDNWTDSDTKLEERANQLLAQGQNQAAEALYQQLIQLHPDSAVPLVLHIGFLDTTGRFPEALAEGRKAVKLDPENFAAQRWLGVLMCRLGQYAQAIEPLETSLKLDHYNNGASIWLADAYLRTGDPKRSSQIIQKLLQDHPKEEQGDTMSWIASTYYNMGDSQSAVLWWKRSAALGSKNAAQWLVWAYSTGYGVPEDAGDSAYWSRIANNSFAWLPRLPLADDWIKWTHGWVVVLIALASAALLPLPTIGAVGYCVGRGVTTDPNVHWTERARRSYPFQIFLGFCVLLLPIIYAAGSSYFPSFAVPIPKWLLFWMVLFVSLISTNWVIVLWAHRYHESPGSAWQNLQNTMALLFLYAPVIIIFGIMAANLPSEWNLQAGFTISAGVLAYFWLQFGGWVRMGRLLHLIVPADKELVEMARELTHRWEYPAPATWLFHWRKANALAFPFCNTILVTEKLRDILSPEEMRAVLAHEMAHLCEDRVTRLMRLLAPLLLLPLFTLSLWWAEGNWAEFIACYAIIIIGFILLRKRRRRMEERADTFGSKADEDTHVYPQALAKLYEANHVPAVMPGKRMVHPHLYDRLLAAGITPDYPRPKPPLRWGTLAALFTIVINVVCLATVWLLVF